MFSDLRLTCRGLASTPGFVLVSVLTLAVGIGATTVIFSALRALVLNPLPYPASHQLVHVWSGEGWSLSAADFLDLRSGSSSFSSFGVYQPEAVNVGRENAQSVPAIAGTHDALRAFGVQPMLGRLFHPEDDLPGAEPVVILSHALWQQVLGSDPHAIGRKLRVNGTDATVVGIMPSTFEFACPWTTATECQVWLPWAIEREKAQRDSHHLIGIARLRDGITVAQADAEIKTIGKRLMELYPDTNTRKAFVVHSVQADMTRGIGKQVWILFCAVVLVLLVACGNVASMLLARSTRRQGEFGVRVALGASPVDLLKIALLESGVLALAGALLGVGLAIAGTEVLQAITPVTEARKAAMTLDGPALAFALAATALTAVFAGIPPALAAIRTSVMVVIRSDARGAIGSRSRHRMLRVLIIAQIAVAFVLANAAVLFSRSYLRMVEENHILDTDAVVTARIPLRGPRYKEDADRVRFWYGFVERLRALPGVTHAAITSKLPLEGGSNTDGLVNDEVYDPAQRRISIERSAVTEEYFQAMGLPLKKGRTLRSEDRVGDIRGIVVNEAFARRAWPNKEPVGELVRGNGPNPWYKARVVGVVDDVRQWGATEEVQPEMYFTPEGHWGVTAIVVLRSRLPAAELAPMLRRELAIVDPELAVKDLRTMRQVVSGATQAQRAVAGLVNFFMAVALGLVAVGLYGTLSYYVQQRTREIGVRVAIGAMKNDIVRLILGQGFRWVGIGLVFGVSASIALGSLLKSLVYRMEGPTAGPLLLATAAVGFSAVLACWVPSRRAARLNPVEALRAEV